MGRVENVEQSQDILASLMIQNGAVMASPDGLTATFNLPSQKSTDQKYYPGTAALKFFDSFADPNSSVYTWNSTLPLSSDAFRDGQVAMILDYNDLAKRLTQENPNLSYRAIPLPQIQGVESATDFAKYWTLTVPKTPSQKANPAACDSGSSSKDCARYQAAWNFIHYMETTGIGTYGAATDRPSPFVPKTLPRSVIQRIDQPNPGRFQTQTAKSWYRGQDPVRVEATFLDMIVQTTTQGVDFQNALDSAARKVTEIFRAREGFQTVPSTEPQKVNQ
jgi:hypothetical protein